MMRPRSQELLGKSNRLPRSIGRVNDLSVGATNQYVVLEGEKGLCIVDLFSDDNVRVVPKAKSYESGRIECNPHTSHTSIVASSSGSSLVLWDISAEKSFLTTLSAHTRAMTGLSWSRHNPNIVATSSLDATIKIWDVRSPRATRNSVIRTFVSAQSHVQWSPHTAHLLASSHGGEVKLWDMRMGMSSETQCKQEDRFIAYMSDICALSWAKTEDNVLLTCTRDKPVKVWNTEKSPSELLYNVPVNLPIQNAMFFPHSSHHILTSHASHHSLYMWDTENAKSFEPLIALQMGDEPIVAFDFQVLGESHNMSGDNICVIAVTKELSLRKWPIPSDFAVSLVESPPPTREELSQQVEDYVPLDLALEFVRAVQVPILGIKINESNSNKRTITVSFYSTKLGEFKLRISFPTMYPRGASPSFEFISPQTHEAERIELLRCLTDVAGAKVAKNKLCLVPCLEALAKWASTNLGDIVDPHPPTPLGFGGLVLTSPSTKKISQTTKSRARARSMPPAMDGPFAVGEKKKTQAIPPIEEGTTNPLKLYTVAPTDTLMGIAIAFKMHPTVLKKLNRLYSNQIIPGQQLWVHKYFDADKEAHRPLTTTLSESNIDPTCSTSSTSSASSITSTTSKVPVPTFTLPTLTFESKTKNNDFITKLQSLTKLEIIKQEIIYWSPTFCVGGTLTLTPHMLIFEPSIEDPLVIQGGILQFQLCIDLSQICSLKLFRTQQEYKHKLKAMKKQNEQKGNSDDKVIKIEENKQKESQEGSPPSSKTAPTIYPCMEIVVLHSRRMQTVYLGQMQIERVEPLYNQTKRWVMESRMQATKNGKAIPPSDLAESPLRSADDASAGASANTLRGSMGSPLPEYLNNTQILDAMGVKHLRSCLPSRFHSVDWELLYSTTLDGISINTFYNHLRSAAPSILLVEDSNGHIFGAYVSEPWQHDSQGHYYGTGESFLFSLSPSFNVYRWSRANDYFMCSSADYIAVGAGEHGFGLYLDSDFEFGTSTSSTTFHSPSLSSSPQFKCAVMEAWGFLS